MYLGALKSEKQCHLNDIHIYNYKQISTCQICYGFEYIRMKNIMVSFNSNTMCLSALKSEKKCHSDDIHIHNYNQISICKIYYCLISYIMAGNLGMKNIIMHSCSYSVTL